MTDTVAEALVARFEAAGVDVAFGFPCEQFEPYYGALAGSDIRHVHARSEASAALMADGYARVSRSIGITDGVGGPGATYTAAGLIEAAGAQSPVLALTGDNDRAFRGDEAIQDADNLGILAPHVDDQVDPDTPNAAAAAVGRALSTTVTGVPGPTHINLTEDLLTEPVDDMVGDGDRGVDVTVPQQRPSPDAEALEALVAAIRAADRPIVLAGEGVHRADAADRLTAFARETAIPVATSMNAKGAVPEDEPIAVGVAGRWGYCEVANDAVSAADLVIGIGCRFGELTTVGWTLIDPSATIAHVDLDPHWLGRTVDVDVPVLGDIGATIDALRRELDGQAGGTEPSMDSLAAAKADWRDSFANRLEADGTPIDPARLTAEISAAMPDGGLLVAATSFPGFMTAAFHEIRQPGIGYLQPRGSDGINAAFPMALGAQLAAPDRTVVCATGDGGFGYHLADIETAVREDLPLTTVVFDNQSLGSSKLSQLATVGTHLSTDFSPDVDYAAVARGFGCSGVLVEDPSEVRPALEDAIASDDPVVVSVRVDPAAVPPVIVD